MIQHECHNIPQVRAKIYELTRTCSPVKTPEEKREERDYWRDFCHETRRDAKKGIRNWNSVSDYPAFDESGEKTEVRVCVGYDVGAGVYLVWLEEE